MASGNFGTRLVLGLAVAGMALLAPALLTPQPTALAGPVPTNTPMTIPVPSSHIGGQVHVSQGAVHPGDTITVSWSGLTPPLSVGPWDNALMAIYQYEVPTPAGSSSAWGLTCGKAAGSPPNGSCNFPVPIWAAPGLHRMHIYYVRETASGPVISDHLLSNQFLVVAPGVPLPFTTTTSCAVC